MYMTPPSRLWPCHLPLSGEENFNTYLGELIISTLLREGNNLLPGKGSCLSKDRLRGPPTFNQAVNPSTFTP